MVRKVVICGAAGRDFHNFNCLYRGNSDVKVVAFTATQIPNIEGRSYPAELAGPGYPDGIPIRPEDELEQIIAETGAEQVDFSYSDVPYAKVMQIGARALAAGADYNLVSPRRTMLKSTKPVIGVGAIRTGCGKSQASVAIVEHLRSKGLRVVAARHPMPYGDLAKQAVQRFAELSDMDKHGCTVEEREEYEQYIEKGLVIYAGVDYEAILRQAEQEADVILWDGGNNDTPFFKPDLHVTILDPLRVGHERLYHPGEVNFLMADLLLINKVDRATEDDIATLRETARMHNPRAAVIEARSEVSIENPEAVRGKKVLVVEDGPTLTHGEMNIGAGFVAAEKYGAEVIDPRPYAVGSLAEAYKKYPHLGPVVPALGYYDEQRAELEQTIKNAPVDAVMIGSPMSLDKLIDIAQPAHRVYYTIDANAAKALGQAVDKVL